MSLPVGGLFAQTLQFIRLRCPQSQYNSGGSKDLRQNNEGPQNSLQIPDTSGQKLSKGTGDNHGHLLGEPRHSWKQN